jgi:DME family drug/metabolite transporter
VYGELLASLSAFCWAAGGILYRKGLDTTNIWTGNLIRTLVAATGFILLMVIQGILHTVIETITAELLFWLIFSAFFAFFVGDIFYLEALNRCGVSRALPVSSTYPLFVAFLAIIIYGHSIGFQIFAGSSVIVLAIYLISEKNGTASISGIILAILAAISWSLSITTIDYLVLYLPVEAVAGIRFVVAVLLTSAMVSVKGFRYDYSALKWLGIGGVVALIIGNYAFVEAIRVAGSAKVTPISATYPVIAAGFARFTLKEVLTFRIASGISLSFLGVLLVILS